MKMKSFNWTKLEISGRKLKATLPAEQASAIGQRIAELLSPLTEGVGLIGDYVHYFRQRTALRALARAHDLAQQSKVKLRPVPPKFLVPWLEAVSLENDDHLIDMWAKLLVSTVKDAKNCNPLFVDVLRKLGPQDANTLEELWKKWKKEVPLPELLETFRWELRMKFDTTLHKLSFSNGILKKRCDTYSRYLKSVGIVPISFEIIIVSRRDRQQNTYDLEMVIEDSKFYSGLRALHLLEEETLNAELPELKFHDRVRVRFYRPTEFAIHFLSACHLIEIKQIARSGKLVLRAKIEREPSSTDK